MSLARAMLNDPKILLLDEPFSNVDVHSAQEMAALLRGMRDEGKTIFVVTHQASHAARGRRIRVDGGWEDCEAHARLSRGQEAMTPPSITRATLMKDIRLEWRSRDAINSMLFFSLLVVVIFSFSLIRMRKNRARLRVG